MAQIIVGIGAHGRCRHWRIKREGPKTGRCAFSGLGVVDGMRPGVGEIELQGRASGLLQLDCREW